MSPYEEESLLVLFLSKYATIIIYIYIAILLILAPELQWTISRIRLHIDECKIEDPLVAPGAKSHDWTFLDG